MAESLPNQDNREAERYNAWQHAIDKTETILKQIKTIREAHPEEEGEKLIEEANLLTLLSEAQTDESLKEVDYKDLAKDEERHNSGREVF